ncbi:MAG: DNA-processing protein DprA, partial [Alistipes sp.]
TDDAYPPLLREIPDYPHILYIKGAQEALTARCVSMVGTREATPYGQRMCIDLVRGLAERIPNLSVVSGLAYGIDVACHRAALAAGAQTVAVLPNPLPNIMPVPHTAVARDILEAGGALVTELHSQVKQKGTFYLARNRIIAALSVGTVVVESPCAGGSLVTAHCADSYNRTVMAVPGRATDLASRGANLLIRNKKAQAVLSANDIIEELMWDLNLADCGARQSAVLPTLTADEAGVLGCFRTSDPVSTEELGELSSLNVGDLSVLLLGLEMAGAVRQLPGNRYMKMVQ